MRDNLPWHWPYKEGEPFWDDWNDAKENKEKEYILREWADMVVWRKDRQRLRMIARIKDLPCRTYVKWEWSEEALGLAKRVNDPNLRRKAHYYSELPESKEGN